MLEFRSAIVNELDEIVVCCSDLTGHEIDEILDNHPEYRIVCIQI